MNVTKKEESLKLQGRAGWVCAPYTLVRCFVFILVLGGFGLVATASYSESLVSPSNAEPFGDWVRREIGEREEFNVILLKTFTNKKFILKTAA